MPETTEHFLRMEMDMKVVPAVQAAVEAIRVALLVAKAIDGQIPAEERDRLDRLHGEAIDLATELISIRRALSVAAPRPSAIP